MALNTNTRSLLRGLFREHGDSQDGFLSNIAFNLTEDEQIQVARDYHQELQDRHDARLAELAQQTTTTQQSQDDIPDPDVADTPR